MKKGEQIEGLPALGHFCFKTTGYNFEVICDRQKYDVNQLRNRVQQYMGKYAKSKDSSKGIKTFSNVAGKKNVFK